MNLRPSGYEPDELPGCSTARHVRENVANRPGLIDWPATKVNPIEAAGNFLAPVSLLTRSDSLRASALLQRLAW